MHRVFVYGSLLSGLYNDWRLKAYGARFISNARTQPGFRICNLGSYPAMIAVSECRDQVVGELYEVDDNALELLDDLEQGFRRGWIQLEGSPEGAFAYMLNEIPNGDYREFVRQEALARQEAFK